MYREGRRDKIIKENKTYEIQLNVRKIINNF